jgi:hypothetical protein
VSVVTGQAAAGASRGALLILAGLAVAGALASLMVIPLAAIMFLFDDTGVPASRVALQALLAATPLPLFGAIAAACLWGVLRSARQGIRIAAPLIALLALLFAAVPDSRLALEFVYGILTQR